MVGKEAVLEYEVGDEIQEEVVKDEEEEDEEEEEEEEERKWQNRA